MPDEQMAGPADGRRSRAPVRPLDPVDRQILRLLRADGRASVRARGRAGPRLAGERLRRGSTGSLEDGVIRGFSARIDQERAGQGTSAYITLKIVQDSWRAVREKLQQLPGAAHMALVGGDFDVLLLVHAADNRALRDLVLTRIQAIPEVLSTRTLLVFEETDLEPDVVRQEPVVVRRPAKAVRTTASATSARPLRRRRRGRAGTTRPPS